MNINAARLVLDTIKEYNKIIIFRHFRPDGDAVGSTKGLQRILQISFPNKQIVLQNCDFSDYLSFLGGEEPLYDDEFYKDALGIVIDTATKARISNQRFSLCEKLIKIDHHIPIESYGQKVQQELESVFPGMQVIRMDADTVSATNPHEKILTHFKDDHVPVLIGTQMVAKGLNLPGVTLVGP